jgi:hypothetical protein
MRYETPELTALTLAITAIQCTCGKRAAEIFGDPALSLNETVGAYADWE